MDRVFIRVISVAGLALLSVSVAIDVAACTRGWQTYHVKAVYRERLADSWL